MSPVRWAAAAARLRACVCSGLRRTRQQQVGERLVVAAFREIEAGRGDGRGVEPRAVPHRDTEGSPSVGEAPLPGKDDAEPVVRLAVAGVRVASRDALDRRAQVPLGLRQASVVLPARGQGDVRAGVARVSSQRLLPVRLGRSRRVPVLGEVDARQVQLVGGVDAGRLGGLGRLLGRCRLVGVLGGAGPPRHEHLTVVLDDQLALRRGDRGLDGELVHVRCSGLDVDPHVQEDVRARAHDDPGPRARRRDRDGCADRRARPTAVTSRRTAASRVAWCTGPISWIGYQNWLNVFVSPGLRKAKSGWLSVKTPAMSSTYGPSVSVSCASHAWPNWCVAPRPLLLAGRERGGRPSARTRLRRRGRSRRRSRPAVPRAM